jgi:hypothetical protein
LKKLGVFLVLLACAGTFALPGGAAAKAGKAKVTVKVLTKNQAALLKKKKLKLRIRATARTRVRVAAAKGNSKKLFRARTIRFKRRGKRTVSLPLTARGRKQLARCGAQKVRVTARYRRGKKKRVTRKTKRLARDARRCSPVNPIPPKPNPATTPDCDPVDPAACMAPFPNDYFTRPDPSTDTGLRLDFKAHNMPKNEAGKSSFHPAYNRNDGFSPSSVILTRVPGLDTPAAFRENRLVSQMNIGAYDDPGQRLALIDTTTNRRVPVWAELDMVPGTPNPHANGLVQGTPQDRVLLIHPAQTLEYGRRYVVALRDLTVGGTPVPPSEPFRYIRDGIETANEQVEVRRAQMNRVFAATDAAGIDRSSLNVAWDFTVASERNLTERVLTMREDAFDRLGDPDLADGRIEGTPPEVTIEGTGTVYNPCPDAGPCQGGQSRYAYKRVRGTIEVPCYMDAPTRDYNLSSTGTPCESGSTMTFAPGTDLPAQKTENGEPVTWDAPFTCVIPRTAANQPAMATGGLKATIFGHGLMGTGDGVQDLGMYPAALEGVACGTDWLGLSQSDLLGHLLTMINILSGKSDLSIFPSLPDRTQQGYINTLYLARALAHEDGLAAHPAFQNGSGEPVFEINQENTGDDLGYYGVSLGGINGGATTALAPDWERATLAVPGIGFSTMLTRSTQFNRFLPTVYKSYTDPVERSIGIAMLQVLWDRGEPTAYADSMLDGSLGTPGHQVLIQESFGDHQVANIQTQTLARSVGATIKAPVLAPGRILDLGTLANGGEYLFTAPADVDPYWNIPTAESSRFNQPGGLPGENAVMMTTDTGDVRPGPGNPATLGTKANPDWNIAPVTGTAVADNEGHDPHQPGATSPATQQMLMPFLLGQGFFDPCGNGPPGELAQPPFATPVSSPNPVPCPAPPIDYVGNGR